MTIWLVSRKVRKARLLWLTLAWSACLSLIQVAQAQDAQLWQSMRAAYGRGDADTLFSLRSRLPDQLLTPLADYWVLSSRLADAQESEVASFLKRWSGTYYEDRVRNEWMRLLGARGDWSALLKHNALFRMQDDDEVQCWVAQAHWNLHESVDMKQIVRLWLGEGGTQPGCLAIVGSLFGAKRFDALLVAQKVRIAVEYGQRKQAQAAASILGVEVGKAARLAISNPGKVMRAYAGSQSIEREIRTWTWIRQVKQSPDKALLWKQRLTQAKLTQEQQQWVLSTLGTWMALNQLPDALKVFPPGRQASMSQTHKEWRLRSAIRDQQWALVTGLVEALPPEVAAQSVWRYWYAVALRHRGGAQRQKQALTLAKALAQEPGYYGALAMEDWRLPAQPAMQYSVKPHELTDAQATPGLLRAQAAMALGLQSEGAREWNYTIALHDQGGWAPEALRATAQWACESALWDRCINTSLRIEGGDDDARRFPTPWLERIQAGAQEANVDAAMVFGLLRQESRFVDVARSSVGASGLMQLMPRTAKWMAHRLGMSAQERSRWREPEVNLRLGLHYFGFVLDSASQSLPLAVASYNAGPRRVEGWLPSKPTDVATWVETIPVNETRDYVQKVVFNTWKYRAVLRQSQPPLRTLLGDPVHIGMVRVEDSSP